MKRHRLFTLGLTVLLPWLFLSCGSSLVMADFVPWYSSLIQRSIDFSSWLPVEYRNNRITIRALSGPDAMAPASTTATWLVCWQDRSPEASQVLVMKPDLTISYQTTSIVVGSNPGRWLVDSNGRLLLGGLMINPPTSSGAAWSSGYSPSQFRNMGDIIWLTIPDTGGSDSRHYQLQLNISSSDGGLYFGNPTLPAPYYLYYANSDWQFIPLNVPALPLLVSNFAATYVPLLFPGQTWSAGGVPTSIICRWAWTDWTNKRVELYCTMQYQGVSPLFVISLPLARPENIQASDVSITVLKTGASSTSGSSTYDFDTTDNFAVAKSGGGYLSSLQVQSSSGSRSKPLVFNKADGSVAKRLEIPVPSYTTSNGSNLSTAGSSIGQQPFLIPYADTWLAIDGFTRKLYVCSSWWN